ncbi:MAG: hypothetical protein KGI60_03270 [Patescibacteria group bacterium]|nr:hypothetical protein [Patescibacteria group bacterium]
MIGNWNGWKDGREIWRPKKLARSTQKLAAKRMVEKELAAFAELERMESRELTSLSIYDVAVLAAEDIGIVPGVSRQQEKDRREIEARLERDSDKWDDMDGDEPDLGPDDVEDPGEFWGSVETLIRGL